MRMPIPAMTDGTVVRQDPDRYRVWVALDAWGGQIPFVSIDVATIGHRDAVRGHWPPLPAVGTRGRVSFTRGDDRTGRWEGNHSPALHDSSTLSPGSGNVDYRAGYAGDWSWTGEDGTRAEVFADGGSVLLGGAMPVPTRHVVDPVSGRVRVPFTAAQRNPRPPAAFPLTVALANGMSLSVTASGSATLAVPAGQSLTLSTGEASIAILPNGAISITTTGQPVVISGGGAAQPVKLASGANSTVLFAE